MFERPSPVLVAAAPQAEDKQCSSSLSGARAKLSSELSLVINEEGPNSYSHCSWLQHELLLSKNVKAFFGQTAER